MPSTNPFRLTLRPFSLGRLLEKVLALDVLAKHYEQRPTAAANQPHEHIDDFLSYTIKALNNKLHRRWLLSHTAALQSS